MSILLYSASAGSGKTYTLTLEYIKLALQEVDKRGYFRRILAVTFTIKAAEEMRSRIIEYLTGISEYPLFPSYGQDQKDQFSTIINTIHQDFTTLGETLSKEEIVDRAKITLQQILQDYGLFSVMTIDSFVQRLSSSFVEELNLPSQFEVILDSNKLIKDLIDQLIEKVNLHGDPQLTALILDYARNEVNEGRNWNLIRSSFHQYLKICLQEDFLQVQNHIRSFSISEFSTIEDQISHFESSIQGELKSIAHQLIDLVQSIDVDDSEFVRGAKGPIYFFKKFLLNPELEPNKFTYLKEAISSGKWFSANSSPNAKVQIEGIADQLSILGQSFVEIYEEVVDKYLLLLLIKKDIKKIALLSTVVEELSIYQFENNAVSISEFSKKIYEVISQDPVPFIYEKLGDRYFHILIDEFQDTSILQWQNFMPLIENSVSINKRNLLVGDPKQSIYKFRGGEVGLIASMTNKNSDLLGNKLESNELDQYRFDYLLGNTQNVNLNNNYRSASAVVEFNNQFFDFVASNVKYQAYSSLLSPIYGINMLQNPRLDPSKGSGFVDVVVIDFSSKDSSSQVSSSAMMLDVCINQIQQSILKGFSYKDIAILTRKNKDSKYVAIQLKELGYPVISSDSLLVHYSSIVGFIHTFMKLANHPDQFTLHELLFQFNQLVSDSEISNDALLNFDGDYMRHCIDFFQEKSINLEPEKLNDTLLLPFVYYLIDNFNLFDHSEGTEYLFKYLDIINEYALVKSNSIAEFLEYYEDNKSNFFISSPDHFNAITISSIHKSKGLEYPIVIVPFASWSHQAGTEKIWYDLKNVTFDELSPSENKKLAHFYSKVNAKNLLGFDDLSIQSQHEKEAIFLDALNMLYVATTRARLHLHIILAKPSEDAHGTSKAIFNMSVGDILYKMAENEGSLLGEVSYLNSSPFVEFISHFVFSEEIQIPPCVHFFDRFTYGSKKVDIQSSLFEMPKFRIDSSKSDMFTLADKKREKGNVLHDFLAKLKGINDWQNYYSNVNDSNSFEFMDDVQLILEDKNIRDFFRDEELLFVENDILCPDGSVFRPDRVIEKDGNVFIIDFKSGKRDEKHNIQLSNYCHILNDMGYSNPKGVLIYLSEREILYV
jgi:ATP-dependent exoDNAse (exonuclease V) beta subunit